MRILLSNYREFAGDSIKADVHGMLKICRIWYIRFGIVRRFWRWSFRFCLWWFFLAIDIIRFWNERELYLHSSSNAKLVCIQKCVHVKPFGNGRNSTAGALSLRWCSWKPADDTKYRFVEQEISILPIERMTGNYLDWYWSDAQAVLEACLLR